MIDSYEVYQIRRMFEVERQRTDRMLVEDIATMERDISTFSRQEAEAVLATVGKIPKRARWETVNWLSVGWGKYWLVDVETDASYTTIRGWFKRAGAHINQCGKTEHGYWIEFYRADG